MEIIKTENIYKIYKDVVALNDVSLNIEKGKLFGLLGVNGAGKTTLIKILSGLIKKTSGKAFVLAKDIDTDIDSIKPFISVSPQETAVAPNLTVLENLEFFADIYDKKNPEKINEILSAFRLDEVKNKRAKTLSGGYMRRLSIAISLVSEPEILFLDEPTLGIDVIARREMWKIISALKGKITIILTSHYLEEIEALCDEVAILSKGKLLAVGTVDEIKKSTNCTSFEDAFISVIENSKEVNIND